MFDFDPEAPDLKAQWATSRDIRFAAMAIGRWPSDPPFWAILACCHENWKQERKTSRGYNKVDDGKVLDEIILVYFRHYDEAQRTNPGLLPSEYTPPDQKIVITEALLTFEKIDQHSDLGFSRLRARLVAIERRLMDEEETEGFPKRQVDGARATQRYNRVLLEWGLEHYGGFSHLHSLALYLQKSLSGKAESDII